MRALFTRADAGEIKIVTSALTQLEVLVVSLRSGDGVLAAKYDVLLTRSRGVKVVDLSRDQLRTAARMRAHYGTLRTPDALQLAAAISTGCHSFVTNDRRMPAPDGLRIAPIPWSKSALQRRRGSRSSRSRRRLDRPRAKSLSSG